MHGSRILACAAALLIFAAASPAALAASPDTYYTSGSRLYSDGDYAEAEKYFVKALELNKRHTSSMFMMGEISSMDVKRLQEAEDWYKQVLQLSRGDKSVTPRTLFSLGRLYILLGRQEDALDSFKKLLAEYPDYYESASVYNHMGIAEYRLERYDRALGYFKTALKHDPRLMEATFNMKNVQNQLSILNTARYHQRMGNNEAAIEHYTSAIERYPNYVAAWYQLGLLYLDEGQWDLAIKHLERAKVLNHGFIADQEIPYRIAGAHLGRGGPEDDDYALVLYESLAGYKDSALIAGEIYAGKGDLEQAEELIAPLTSRDTDRLVRAEACYQMGMLYTGRGDKAGAMGYFQKALSAAPEVDKYKNPPVSGFVPAAPEEEEEEDDMDDEAMSDYY